MTQSLIGHALGLVLFLTGLIHLLPAVAAVFPERLQSLYGLEVKNPTEKLLLRHRAVLFAILGIFLLLSAFEPDWYEIASVAGLLSMLSFIAFARMGGNTYPAAIGKVVRVDLMLSALLAALFLLRLAYRLIEAG